MNILTNLYIVPLLMVYISIKVYWAQLIVLALLIVFVVFLRKNIKKKNKKSVKIFSALIGTTIMLVIAFYIIFPTKFPYVDMWIYGKTGEEIQAVYGEAQMVGDDKLRYFTDEVLFDYNYYYIQLDEDGKAVEVRDTFNLWSGVRARTIVTVSLVILAISLVFIFLFAFCKYTRLERLADKMSRTGSKVILGIVIVYMVGAVIYVVADSKWEEEQRAMVAQDFLEAMATIDEERIDLYCDERLSFMGGCENYEEFRYEIIPEWQNSYTAATDYKITIMPSDLPGTYFFEMEYLGKDGNGLSVSGSYKIERTGNDFFIDTMWLSCYETEGREKIR